MSSLNNVLSSSGEDFFDELISLAVYKEGNGVMKDIKSKLDLKDDSVLDEAISGALTTLQYGLMNVVIITVTEYAMTKTVVVLSSIFAYIKGRRIIRAVVDAGTNIVSKVGPIGWVAGNSLKSVSNVLVANQNETLAMANMANSSSNNIVSAIGRERQNQILIKGQKLKRVDNTKSNMYSVRNKSRQKGMDMFIHKFETGTWKNTAKDKKLYFDCTGQDTKIVPFNMDFVTKINSYSSILETAKGEIYTNTKATLDLLIQLGANKGI